MCFNGEYAADLCGINLRLDGFRCVYTVITAFMWFMTALLSPEYFAHYHNTDRYFLFCLLTLGATQGVFLSADLMTAFLFFEVMSLASFPWVAQDETGDALRAANTYLAVAVIGGLVTLMGMFLLNNLTGTLVIDELYDACKAVSNRGTLYTAGACILFGFGAKAGMFPLHIWLPKAHPVAPAPASALLSGVLTKAGVFGMIVLCCHIFRYDEVWGFAMLIVGVITMVWGAVLGVLSVNLKRTLACSSMSQIGFILTGLSMCCLLGHENALAARGVMLHMVNHSLIKLVLFMTAGAIYMNVHTLDLNKLRGFGRNKPILHFAFLMGALGIGGIPLWNGYISKTLLHESIVEFYAESGLIWIKIAEWLFLIAGGLTVAYMTKLYVCIFVEKNTECQEKYDGIKKSLSPLSAAALIGSAAVLPLLGMTSGITMNRIAELGQSFIHGGELEHAVNYFSLENLKGGGISLAIGVTVYFLVIRGFLMKKENGVRVYADRLPKWLDLEDKVYRPLLLKILPGCLGPLARVFGENKVLAPAGKFIASKLGLIKDEK
ncbi:MAG: sodium:proton antiporter [Oscillospiraceae bacterium]|nr:sodium:proton antiporter [Oscillospiraceae bacterium]